MASVAMHSVQELQLPDSCLSVARRVISGTLASAFDKGQSRFAALAISWNFASSMLGALKKSDGAGRSTHYVLVEG